mgnify:CR=1 FL=1
MEKSKKEITYKVEGEKWQKALDNAFKKLNAKAKIDGFRPGKAPKDVYIKHYGVLSLYEEAAEKLAQEAYYDMLKKEKIVPITQGSVDIKNVDENAIEYIFTVITKPEVEIKKYKNLKVKKDKVNITKEEINNEIEKLLDRYTELAVKDGTLEKSDTAIIDYEGFKDGIPFEGGKAENYSLEIGSNTFIPGFEDSLIGMKPGEEKEINVTFPEDYHAENLKGQPVVFKVKLHEIKEKIKRELNDDFFEDLALDDVKNVKDLENHMKKYLEDNKKMEIENKFIDEMLSKISENTECDIPEELIDDEVHYMIHEFEHTLNAQGLSLEMYHQITKTTHEDLHKQYEEQARKNVLYRLIIEKLFELENIEVNEDEINKEIKRLADEYKVKEEEILREYESKDNLKANLQLRKLIDKLEEYNK